MAAVISDVMKQEVRNQSEELLADGSRMQRRSCLPVREDTREGQNLRIPDEISGTSTVSIRLVKNMSPDCP